MEFSVVHVRVATESVAVYQGIGLYSQDNSFFSFFLSTTVDRRGESEESGDDETRRRSINGDVDPNQPPGSGKLMHPQHV